QREQERFQRLAMEERVDQEDEENQAEDGSHDDVPEGARPPLVLGRWRLLDQRPRDRSKLVRGPVAVTTAWPIPLTTDVPANSCAECPSCASFSTGMDSPVSAASSIIS